MIENYIKKSVELEQMNCCIISTGGCGTHYLSNQLENNGLKIRTSVWNNYLVHFPKFIKLDIPIIYVYRDLREAFISQIRNNFAEKNYMMIKTNNKKYSNENFIQAMYEQFKSFINKDVFIIEYKQLFNYDVIKELYNFLNIKKFVFKNNYKTQKQMNFNNYKSVFSDFKKEIEEINSVTFPTKPGA
jgi:hypothetical protein